MVGNVVSAQGAVISSLTAFDSPAIFLNDTPYLKKDYMHGKILTYTQVFCYLLAFFDGRHLSRY